MSQAARRVFLVCLVIAGLGIARCVTVARAQEVPVLTALERTQLELLQVRTAYAQLVAQFDACKAEVGAVYNALGTLRASAASAELTAQEQKWKAAIEAAHPGWVVNPKTGALSRKP